MKSIQYWCVVLALVSSNVGAQNSDSWDWKIAPNLWMVGIDGKATNRTWMSVSETSCPTSRSAEPCTPK